MVTNAGPQLVATATFKVKSTAGVDVRAYSINTEDVPTINRIAGTFDVEIDYGPVFTYAGNVVFQRFTPAIYGGASGFYHVNSGLYTVTASGQDASGATGCQQSGSKQFSIPAANGSSIDVSGTGQTQIEPYEYSFSIIAGGPSDTMDITLHGCPPGAEEWEGYVRHDVPVQLYAHSEGPAISADGIGYAGSYSENQGGLVNTQSWSFTGTE